MTTETLGHLLTRIDRRGESDLPLLGVSVATGVRLRGDDDGRPAPSLDLSGYKVVEPGDIIMNALGKPHGSIGRSEIRGITSPAYWILRAQPTLDSRYAHHLLRSQWAVSRYAGLGKNLPPNQFDIPWETFAKIEAWLPTVEEQRRIADFLDDRVARIDQIIAARQQQLSLHVEAASSAASSLLESTRPGAPLSSLSRIIDTEHKTAPRGPGGGFWIAGTNAIRDGELVQTELREIDIDAYREWTVRGQPRPGDVLLTREAPVGHVALLSDGDDKIAIGQRVVLLQPLPGLLDPGFLRLVLMQGALRPVIEQASAGSLHPHLNIADISRLRIPDLPVNAQRAIATHHNQLLGRTKERASAFSRQVALLQEYKQSLITAAVTGEFDVTTASTRIPE